MTSSIRALPLRRTAIWGFLLNAGWEFVQCPVFYDMWNWGLWRATIWMWGAIFGDVLIVLGVGAVCVLLVGHRALSPPTRCGWTALIGVGFVASIALEWLARTLSLWGYSAWMPTITVLDHTVGLSPIVQITTLPALSIYLATRSNSETDASR